ncbi:MAG: Nif3-like dinuclear metal center hexameric protein [Deltaproteobacteria bacterium]|nr:Nif3-like dinuclear metal center hexameric protein [Deltaproteobacteria bacterium]
MVATVADIIDVLETLAPSDLAEEWDNVGLQVGDGRWPVRTVWVALDPDFAVVKDACENNVDLLITHHPLIFKALHAVDFNSPIGEIIQLASRHRMALFSAHTNLDSVTDGINDILASRIGLKNLRPLGDISEPEKYKLVVFAPVEHEQKVLNSLLETEAGKIASYSCCSFRSKGKGTFRPDPSSKPIYGKIGEISQVDEIRIETVIPKTALKRIVAHLCEHHPYETMAYDVYPLLSSEAVQGIGRVGELDEKTTLKSFALAIKETLGLEFVSIAGKPDLVVQKAAVCSGSGASLMDRFFSSGAQVYISGDLRYHDARAVESTGLGIIDIGHFASEHLIVEVLSKRLATSLTENGIHVKVEAYGLEKDPFIIL